jgi:hypothetical protein
LRFKNIREIKTAGGFLEDVVRTEKSLVRPDLQEDDRFARFSDGYKSVEELPAL